MLRKTGYFIGFVIMGIASTVGVLTPLIGLGYVAWFVLPNWMVVSLPPAKDPVGPAFLSSDFMNHASDGLLTLIAFGAVIGLFWGMGIAVYALVTGKTPPPFGSSERNPTSF